MKYVIMVFLIIQFSAFSFAKNSTPDSKGLYIVPGEPEFIKHSRFKIEITSPFEGPQTQKIAYVFPEILTGESYRVIELTRIPNTENSWVSDELTAHCTVLGDIFSCNVYVNKEKLSNFKWFDLLVAKAWAFSGGLCDGQALSHIQGMGLSPMDVTSYSAVIGNFCSNEPAGFLTYEFK